MYSNIDVSIFKYRHRVFSPESKNENISLFKYSISRYSNIDIEFFSRHYSILVRKTTHHAHKWQIAAGLGQQSGVPYEC